MTINYDTGSNATAQFDGNISSLTWQVQGSISQTYSFTYDFLNRLTAANHNSPMNDYRTSYEYDERGNMAKLSRKGV